MLLSETLPHHLPWYFGLTVFLVWLAATVVLVSLLRRRLRARPRRRGTASGQGGRQPALEPGHDVEVW